MKVACIVDSISRQAGGLNTSVRRLMQSTNALGDNVCIIAVRDSDSITDLPKWNPVPVRLAEALGPRRFGYAPGLEAQLREFDPEVVHVHGIWTYTSVVSSRWQRRTQRPIIIHPHGMLDPWAIHHSAWKKRLAGWLFEYKHLHGAACIRALCQSEAEAIRAFGLTNPIAIIPNGIDLPDEIPQERTNEGVETSTSKPCSTAESEPGDSPSRLLYLGRIHPKKGLVNLLRAWASVFKSRPFSGKSWQLSIAGWDEGGHEMELKTLCTALGLSWSDEDSRKSAIGNQHQVSVQFLGPQFGEAKAAAYRDCDAFILPSFSEGLPMVVLEAWAYGKPVLITPQCNLPEGFAAGAAIRIEANVESIAAGLEQLHILKTTQGSQASDLGRQQLSLSDMGSRGRDLVRTRFTWPEIASDLRDVYTWLCGQGKKPDCVHY